MAAAAWRQSEVPIARTQPPATPHPHLQLLFRQDLRKLCAHVGIGEADFVEKEHQV